MKIFIAGMMMFLVAGAASAKSPGRDRENISVAFSKIRACLDQMDDQSTAPAVVDDINSSSEGLYSSEGENPVSE